MPHSEITATASAIPPAIIDARSRKQAMDWSLVLASQSIGAVIECSENHWFLAVDPVDHSRALEAIRLYQHENRWRRWLPHAEQSLELFHPACLVWLLSVALVFHFDSIPNHPLRASGALEVGAFVQGDWWRMITATMLHGDLSHLATNATTGFLLLSLAMGRFGAGNALLLTLLAGAGGNLLVAVVRAPGPISLGASGTIMGALGLLTLSGGRGRPLEPNRRRRILGQWMAGLMLFTLFGLNPDSDVVAHAGGFLAGTCLAAIATRFSRSNSTRKGINTLSSILWISLILVAWRAAMR